MRLLTDRYDPSRTGPRKYFNVSLPLTLTTVKLPKSEYIDLDPTLTSPSTLGLGDPEDPVEKE